MKRIGVVTDSTADLPRELVEEYGITVVPLNVHFGEKVYKDGVDLDAEEFFQRLAVSDDLPTTSQPSAGDFAGVYRELAGEVDAVLSIHISASLSGTVQSALLGRDMLEDLETAPRIEIVDSKSVSLGLGLLVLRAAEMVRAGDDLEAITTRIGELIDNLRLFFTVDTLEYLYQGGRLSRTGKVVGSILNIRPIIAMEDGQLEVIGKNRGMRKSLTALMDHVREVAAGGEATFAVVHACAEAEADHLQEEIGKVLPGAESLRNIIGPVVGTHAGPGSVGVFVLREA